MTEATAGRLLTASLLTALGITAWADLKGKVPAGTRVRDTQSLAWPNPRRFVDTGIVFALLGLLSTAAPALAATLGAGAVVGLGTIAATRPTVPGPAFPDASGSPQPGASTPGGGRPPMTTSYTPPPAARPPAGPPSTYVNV